MYLLQLKNIIKKRNLDITNFKLFFLEYSLQENTSYTYIKNSTLITLRKPMKIST